MDLHAITDSDSAAKSGVQHGEALLRFAEAVYAGDDAAIRTTRVRVQDSVGDEGMISAAAVVGNFTRMVRIADSTGIPLDTPVEVLTSDFRGEIGIDAFGSSANTPDGGPIRKLLAPVLRPVLRRAFNMVARRMMPKAQAR